MKLPPDTRAAIGIVPGTIGAIVVLATPPRAPTLDALLSNHRERGLHVLVRHPAGIAWPDKLGEGMVEYALAHGDVAGLAFDSVADALRAHARLRELGATP